jgi:hypothetical protein
MTLRLSDEDRQDIANVLIGRIQRLGELLELIAPELAVRFPRAPTSPRPRPGQPPRIDPPPAAPSRPATKGSENEAPKEKNK